MTTLLCAAHHRLLALAAETAEHAEHAAEAAGHHAVPFSTTLIFTGILVAMVLTLALEEKIHAKKSLITLGFGVLAVFVGDAMGVIPGAATVSIAGEELSMPVYIGGIDWGVICIILASSIFVDVTSRSGLFTWIAIKLTKASAGDPYKLLWYYGVMTVVFSAVLNNVTAMIIGGLLTLISSVPNIIVGQAAGISFMKFFVVAAPYTLAATVLTILMGAKLFKIEKLIDEGDKRAAMEKVMAFDENDGIESEAFFKFGAIMSGLFIVALATTSVLPVAQDLGMGFVAGTFAFIMLIRYKHEVDEFYKAVDWDLIGFFCFLFAVINVMEHAQVLALIGEGLTHIVALGPKLGSAAMLVAAAGFSSVTDNIPLAAMLAKILQSLGTASDSPMWWAVVFGANLGGNITPIGSASTVVAVTIIHKNKLPMSFGGFVKVAVPYAIAQIALAVVYVVAFLS
jgi:Na+/H+ antiporter NhaD/arsenite permease-like protein